MTHPLRPPAVLLLCLLPFAPLQAQDTAAGSGSDQPGAQRADTGAEEKLREGAELLGEGLQLLLNGMKDDVVPLLEDLRKELGDEMGPLVEGLRGKLDELNAYYPPEVLPNGDIIIRRKVPLQVEPEADGEVEL